MKVNKIVIQALARKLMLEINALRNAKYNLEYDKIVNEWFKTKDGKIHKAYLDLCGIKNVSLGTCPPFNAFFNDKALSPTRRVHQQEIEDLIVLSLEESKDLDAIAKTIIAKFTNKLNQF
jgi:hypothetical protein